MERLHGGVRMESKLFWFEAAGCVTRVNAGRKRALRYHKGVDTYLYVEARVDDEGKPYLYFGWEEYPEEDTHGAED